jgi:diadenosine tetraphosphatase ApaH/serine/threonine PP2A family protein phosphatase
MRSLLISDIHANLEALEAVLGSGHGCETVLVLGDLVGYGADPNAVVERVRQLPVAAIVRGNHDKVATGGASTETFNPVAKQAIAWTTRALTPENQAWLLTLPRGPAAIDADLEICHGAPFDEDFYVFDELDARRAADSASRSTCLFGHTHVQGIFRVASGVIRERVAAHTPRVVDYRVGGRTLINCGAVGQPRDGDPRAAYGILDTETGTVTLARVAYDVSAAQAKILAAGLPPQLASRLALGR